MFRRPALPRTTDCSTKESIKEQVKGLVLGLFRRKPMGCSQGLNRLAPVAHAQVRSAQVKIGFSELGILSGRPLKMWDRLPEVSLVKKRQSFIETTLSRAESRRQGTGIEAKEKNQPKRADFPKGHNPPAAYRGKAYRQFNHLTGQAIRRPKSPFMNSRRANQSCQRRI
jgi:hypothetical protein